MLLEVAVVCGGATKFQVSQLNFRRSLFYHARDWTWEVVVCTAGISCECNKNRDTFVKDWTHKSKYSWTPYGPKQGLQYHAIGRLGHILSHWGTSLQHAKRNRKMEDEGPIM